MGSGAKIALVALLILMVVAVAKFVQNGSEEGRTTEAGAKKDGPHLVPLAGPQLKKAAPPISNRRPAAPVPGPATKTETNTPPSPPSPPVATKTDPQTPAPTPAPVPPANPTPPVAQQGQKEPATTPPLVALQEIEKKAASQKNDIVQGTVKKDPNTKTFSDPATVTPVSDPAKKDVTTTKTPEISPTPLTGPSAAYPLSHKVAEGESWWTIAEKYYGAGNAKHFKTIQDANGGGKFVIAGKTIKIPAPPAPPAPKPVSPPTTPPTTIARDTGEAFDYLVQKGDTLWTLAKKFGRKVTDIQVANKLEFQTTLYAGTTIKIPKK